MFHGPSVTVLTIVTSVVRLKLFFLTNINCGSMRKEGRKIPEGQSK